MLANYLIGLREGLEAALVVGILVAYLVRTDHWAQLRPLWVGVGGAVALSLGAGAIFTFTSNSLSFRAQETFGGVMSIIAVALVTWMIFWMRRMARHLKDELQGRLAAAIAVGSFTVAITAFIAVAREGIETALFVWAAVDATGSTTRPLTGAVLGLLTAVALGYLIYRRSVRLNLAAFFRFTGAGLVVVAAGVLAYGVHDLQEAGYLTAAGMGNQLLDATGILPPSSWWGSLFKGIFSISATPSRLEGLVWVAYLVPTMTLFLRPHRATGNKGGPARAATEPATPSATESATESATHGATHGASGASGRGRASRQLVVGGLGMLATVVLVGACTSTSGDAISIIATDSTCEVARTNLDAGKSTFEVRNDGSKVTEVYVYGDEDRVVTERENIGPGTRSTFSVDLAAGDYEIACKPGQIGDGIRQAISVTGTGGARSKPADRTVELDATDDYAFIGMDGFTARAGETIEFRLHNLGALEHEFEVFGPDGEVLGEIGPTAAGRQGVVTLTLAQAGSYRFVCGIDDHEALGMKGTFIVA